jgi:EAL domain-containing protein (putative c-di-GMP-specific phosphodiesterase class I)
VASNADDAAITTAIISMARNLNLKVTAEGVETEEQLSLLRARRCDPIQGYYFRRPLPPEQVPARLPGLRFSIANYQAAFTEKLK